MSPNELTTLIASNMDRELDIPFRLQLMERVKYWRSRLLMNMLQKTPARREQFRQSLYLTMQPVADILCAPLVSCAISESLEKVPKVLRIGQLFDYVGGPDGRSPFRRVHPGMGNYLQSGKLSKLFPEYDFVNERVRSTKIDLPLIRLDAVFDDPMAVERLSCSCNNKQCDEWEIEFPMPGDIAQLVVQSILQTDYNRPDPHPTPETNVTQQE